VTLESESAIKREAKYKVIDERTQVMAAGIYDVFREK
jgi:hypothetical protein